MKIFISHSRLDSDFVDVLVRIVEEGGNQIYLPADMTAGSNLSSGVSAAIRSADLLVAVVASMNVNVFFEMGLAAGANVPMLVAASAHASLPMDIASIPYVKLSGDKMRDAHLVAHRVRDFKSIQSREPTEFLSAEAALKAAINDPQILESLAPMEFAELIARLLEERGFLVKRMDVDSDIGADLAINSGSGDDLSLVEVKKLSRQSRVPVEAVRRLLSAVDSAGAKRGLLVSTVGYTSAAMALAADSPILLKTLQDVLAATSTKALMEDRS